MSPPQTCFHLADVLEMRRCGMPEGDEMHDPLGPFGCHVFDPMPDTERTD